MKDTNPATAFPLHNRTHTFPGMTLRDYFAGQALAGILTNATLPWSVDQADVPDKEIPKAAYQLADEMLNLRHSEEAD